MYFVKVLTISALFGALIAIGNGDPIPRLTGGQQVDNLRQFPHHVYIIPFQSGRKCGGSILNAQWILTSAACIRDSIRLELHFGKKNQFDYGAAFFSISVNSDQVYVYPTNYDDLALIRIPMRLVFSDTIMPVNISRASIEGLRNKFAVLPGFNDPEYYSTLPPTTIGSTTYPTTTLAPTTVVVDDNLKYGMFNVLDNSLCKQTFGAGNFDEYTQLCTEGWGGNPNTPCDSDFGSGLIVGWPAKTELIGMFSMYSSSCNTNSPSVYTYVPKYLPWIESMIQG